MDHRRKLKGRSADPLTHAGEVSRRAMVAGTMATTTVAAILPLANAAYAQGANADMMAFLLLSEALTGVSRQTLAPELSEKAGDILNSDPGIDPINIKNAYFDWIKAHDPTSSFGKLLQLARDNLQSLGDIVPKVNGSADDIKFLARSIVLWEQLHAAQPDNAFFWRNVASGRNNLGEALILAARYGDAARELQRSIEISEALAKADPADLQLRVYRSVAEINLARASLGQGRREAAHALAQQALQALSALPEAAVSDPNVRAYHALGWHALAQASAAGTPAACSAERSALELLLPLQKTPGIPPGALQPGPVRAALARCTQA